MTEEQDLTPELPEEEEVVIDFHYQHARRAHGDITVILTWNFNGDNPDAVLLLVPTHAPPDGEELRMCCVARNDAWKWSRTHNNDRAMAGYHGFGKPPTSEEWQQMNAVYYCMQLNLSADDARTPLRVRSLIEDYLGDLIMMPPPPIRDDRPEALFTVTDMQTGSVEEFAVREN